MKTLKFKTLLILLMCGFVFMSCSSDDDAPQEQEEITQDRLIGNWLFESAEEREEPLTACEKTSILEFYDAATGGSVLYTDTSDGACIPLLGGNFSYEFISESTIKFTNADADASTYNSELISVSDTELVLKDFAFIPGKIVFKKAP